MAENWATNCPECGERWVSHHTGADGNTVTCAGEHTWRWDEIREATSQGGDVPEYRLVGEQPE
jgi:hypothetical protein